MVNDSTKTMKLPPSGLLEALSRAFTYPWNGLAETLEPLKAFAGTPQAAAYSHAIEGVLALGEQFPDRTAEQLAYTRLFIGSFKMEAPPYASFYLEENHTLNGNAAAEVESVFAQFGIQLDADEKAPADHLRYLLAFLGLVAARFEETGELAFAETYVDFRDEYIMTWIDQFQVLVERYAEEPRYYAVLVGFIVNVLREDGAPEDAPKGD